MRYISIWFVVVLTACQSMATRTPGLEPGARLVLHRALTIPVERASVNVQDGQVVRRLNLYHPYCRFEVRSLRPRPQTIQPDTFVIKEVSYEETYSAPVGAGTQIFGSISIGVGSSGVSAGNGTEYITYATGMRLHSPRQPQVLALTCQHWQDPIDARYLTLRQMRDTLGAVMSLESP